MVLALLYSLVNTLSQHVHMRGSTSGGLSRMLCQWSLNAQLRFLLFVTGSDSCLSDVFVIIRL